MLKLLLGGSPCTHWSIARHGGRETQPEGIGWELFQNYLIAKEKFKPDLFLYENNKSAAQPIKDQISKELGVPLMYIDSALVSAQTRKRFYAFNWTAEQPEDRGIFLRDILESGEEPSRRMKSYALTATYGKAVPKGVLARHERTMVAEPVGIGYRNRRESDGKLYRRFETSGIPKSNALTTVQTDSMVAEPIRIGTVESGVKKPGHDSQSHRVYSPDGKGVTLCGEGGEMGAKTGLYAVPTMKVKEAVKQGYAEIMPGECVDLSMPNSKTRRGRAMREKANCLTTTCNMYEYLGTLDAPIYEVDGGYITIKGRKYPVRLQDGYYIIRKLTPVECERLQTLPDGYTAGVSDTQRYRGLGNGWTAEVIIHILAAALKDIPRDTPILVLSMYDGIGTGRYCLDRMGFRNVRYFAYEIDPYAIKIAMRNYPDIYQCGDAFGVREGLPEYCGAGQTMKGDHT